MKRRLFGAVALACTVCRVRRAGRRRRSRALGADAVRAPPGGLRAGPAPINAASWVSATGMIRPDTVRDFEAFAEKTQSARADASRSIPKAARCTARSRSAAPSAARHDRPRSAAPSRRPARPREATLSPRADCESMCAFVLLAGSEPRGAERGARARAPDLARRPPRRRHRRGLFGGRPRAGAARHRQAGAIHGRDGRRRRTAGSLAAHSAMGADARADARRIAPHASRQYRCRRSCARPQPAAITGTGAAAATNSAPTAHRGIPARANNSERGWSIAERSGAQVLARRHPLTVEGDDSAIST